MRKGGLGLVTSCLILLLVGASLWVVPARVEGAAISGTVTFDGTPPPPKKIEVTKNAEKCGTEYVSEELVVGEGRGIQNVVVSIVNAPPGQTDAPASKKVQLNQKGCRFIPHVAIVPAGSKLVVHNSDGISHNFHTFSKTNPAINKAQPGFKKKMTIRSLKKPETIKVECNYHGWMRAWLVVTDNPHTVLTDASGTFQLAGVPAGTYTLKFWHETLGETTQEVTVQDDATATVQTTMGLK